MTIPRIGFTHDPPWKYAIIFKFCARWKTRDGEWEGNWIWTTADFNRGNRGRRYKTIQAALQAVQDFKA